MKHKVLDTNILHQEGLFSGRMQVLKKLVDAQLITVYIPDIVLREFTTKRISEITNSLNSIQGNLAKADKKLDHETELKKRSTLLEKEVAELKLLVEASVTEDVLLWVESHKVQILEFKPENIGKVVDDYFAGSGVFKSLKSREDFPDSMIHQSICDLVAQVGKVHAVLMDGAFKKGMMKEKDVEVLDSIKALFELDDINAYLSNEPFKELFTSQDVAEQLRLYFIHQKDLINYVYIPDGAVDNTAIIGIDVYAAEINWPDEKSIRDIVISNFYTASDNEFIAEISFVTSSTVHYVSDYGSYLRLEKDVNREVDMDSMNGEGVCDLYESFIVKFSGKIHFSFAAPKTIEEASAVMTSLVERESEVIIDLEMDFASLLAIIA